MGRSRKPLYGQLYRGFESPSFRENFARNRFPERVSAFLLYFFLYQISRFFDPKKHLALFGSCYKVKSGSVLNRCPCSLYFTLSPTKIVPINQLRINQVVRFLSIDFSS